MMEKSEYKKRLMECYEQDLEIILYRLTERLFYLQTQYFDHHTDDLERTKLRDKMDKLDKQLFHLKKILDLQITYKGDLHEMIFSRL